MARVVTKCVVASPLMVLLLWSLAISMRSTTTNNTTPSTRRQVKYTTNNNGMSHQQEASLKMKQVLQQQQQEQTNGENVDVTMMQQQQQQEQQSSNKNKNSNNVVVRPRPHPRKTSSSQQVQQQDNNNAMMNVQGANTMMVVERDNAMMNAHVLQGNAVMAASQNGVDGVSYTQSHGNGNVVVVQPANVQGASTVETNAAMQQQQQQDVAMTLSQQDENTLSNVQGNPVMMNSQGSNNVDNANVVAKKNTRILYYDPNASSSNNNGIPDQVYDESGKSYSLASLASDKTEIYMEKASLTIPQVEYTWGHSQKQDQFIIVATVATMALLVGALSARRLRSRNFLNSCIENEEEVAYDAAYTLGYDTFGGGGPWRGDLEKFDV